MIKFLAYLKKMNKLGVAMTEYAVLLAFVAAVGAGFTSDSGLGSSISGAVGKAVAAIGLVSGEKQASVKDKAFNLFTNQLYGYSTKGQPYDSFAAEIMNGGTKYIEQFLKDNGIDTIFGFDNMYLGTRESDLKAMGLLPDDMVPNSAKLLTIANENGLDATHKEPFSATQYLFYKKDDKLYLAGTRQIDYVQNYVVNDTITGSYKDKDYTITKKLNSASCVIEKDGTIKTFKPSVVTDDFVRYEPK